MRKKLVSVEPRFLKESICSRGSCLDISSKWSKLCKDCKKGKYSEVEPKGRLTSGDIYELKHGSLGSLGFDVVLVDRLTKDLLSRQRVSHPDRIFDWSFLSDLEITRYWIDEVSYQIAMTASSLIDPSLRRRHVKGSEFSLQYFNPFYIRGAVEESMREYFRLVSSNVYLVRIDTQSIDACVTVCHPSTGIRAAFVYNQMSGLSKFIRAKESQVSWLNDGTFDECNMNQLSPTLYVGRGIGTNLYRIAGKLTPGVRWDSGTLKPGSAGVRKKLHLEDPWRWASACEADGCSVRWSSATYLASQFHRSEVGKRDYVLNAFDIRFV